MKIVQKIINWASLIMITIKMEVCTPESKKECTTLKFKNKLNQIKNLNLNGGVYT